MCTEPWAITNRMGQIVRQKYDKAQSGVTLLEVSICMFLAGMMISASWPMFQRLVGHERLRFTQERLVSDMRYVQAGAGVWNQYGMIRFSTYTPHYSVLKGLTMIASRDFAPGVNYREGYLQLGTSQLIYNVSGNASVGGVIQLVEGQEEADINLYIGTGLIVTGGILP
jgi:hypothetical protein